MTTAEDTAAYLEQKIKQLEEQNAAILQQLQQAAPQGQQQQARLDAPPTTYPEGSKPFDFRPARIRSREKAIAKIKVLARTRGGIWDADPRVPAVYGHRAGDDLTPACEYLGEEEFKASCQRTCWTPESETRFLYATGLKDLARNTLVPLTPKDPKDRDAILELVGQLKGLATAQDVVGRYPDRAPTHDEVGTAQGAARARRAG